MLLKATEMKHSTVKSKAESIRIQRILRKTTFRLRRILLYVYGFSGKTKHFRVRQSQLYKAEKL